MIHRPYDPHGRNIGGGSVILAWCLAVSFWPRLLLSVDQRGRSPGKGLATAPSAASRRANRLALEWEDDRADRRGEPLVLRVPGMNEL